MNSRIIRSLLIVIWAVFLAFLIALAGQGIWTALLSVNLAADPALPWSVPLMAILLWLIWLYLGGRGQPRRTSTARHTCLRANPVPGAVFAWAVVSGGLAIAALAGYWIVMARIVRLPGNAIPGIDKIPLLTVALAVGMGSLISPLLEQAGFWGYGQSLLEKEFPAAAAVIIMAVFYALGPHPPAGGPAWPRLVFYFFTGLTFGVMAYLTNSILPGLLVHILGILAFFLLVWPNDPSRPLIASGGMDLGFWLSLGLGLLCTVLAILAFGQLARTAKRARPAAPTSWNTEKAA